MRSGRESNAKMASRSHVVGITSEVMMMNDINSPYAASIYVPFVKIMVVLVTLTNGSAKSIPMLCQKIIEVSTDPKLRRVSTMMRFLFFSCSIVYQSLSNCNE